MSYYLDPYDDCEPEHVCYDCDVKDKILDDCKEWLESVVHQLYSQDVDLSKLEDHLQELCHLLEVKFPTQELMIGRKA